MKHILAVSFLFLAVCQANSRQPFVKLPLTFQANHGQTDPAVKFLSRGPGYTLFLAEGEAVLSLTGAALRMKLVRANRRAAAVGLEELPAKANYLLGNDPTKWRTGVPLYAKVRYKDAYPGIDLVYYGNQEQLEFDLVVAPGSDPGQIALDFEGAASLHLDPQGDLVASTAAGPVRLRRPLVYQEVDGVRREIAGAYRKKSGRRVGFRIGPYDRARPLVVDPVLVYSTYLGGGNFDAGLAIAVDAAGSAYVTGSTLSTNFPTTAGAP